MARNTVVLAGAALVLGACGGGGNGVSSVIPTPALANRAPVIAQPTADTVVQENVTGTVLSVDASDPDGDALSYALSAGDTGPLRIDGATGAITFATTPDFEAPADGDADNTYTVMVTVTDGRGGSADTDFTIRVTDEPAPERGLYREKQFNDIQATRNLEYAPGLFADAFAAADSFGEDDDRPLIILAGGGGFIVEDRTSVESIATDFASRGWLAVTIDYRTLGRFPRSEAEIQVAATKAVHDMFAAVRSARADNGFLDGLAFDDDTIVVGGESAGGVMAVTAAALDPDDTITLPAIRDYLADNGGVYGDVGAFSGEDSTVQAALPLSGAVFDLGIIDADTAPTFGAHEENDTVVPCDEGQEGATGQGATVIGTCDFVPDMVAKGVRAEGFIVADDAGHVDFTDAEREAIYAAAAELFVEVLFPADEEM